MLQVLTHNKTPLLCTFSGTVQFCNIEMLPKRHKKKLLGKKDCNANMLWQRRGKKSLWKVQSHHGKRMIFIQCSRFPEHDWPPKKDLGKPIVKQPQRGTISISSKKLAWSVDSPAWPYLAPSLRLQCWTAIHIAKCGWTFDVQIEIIYSIWYWQFIEGFLGLAAAQRGHFRGVL